jgi:lactate dehydrogenase-like 2-hydroxyacid dehydrogenase
MNPEYSSPRVAFLVSAGNGFVRISLCAAEEKLDEAINRIKAKNHKIEEMERKSICIIGTGLIGGSLAIQLHEKKISSRLIGVETNQLHAEAAIRLELVDEILEMDDAIAQSEVIILAIAG